MGTFSARRFWVTRKACEGPPAPPRSLWTGNAIFGHAPLPLSTRSFKVARTLWPLNPRLKHFKK